MGREELKNAQTAKKDEFYTQLEDINAEMMHYEKQFKDKVVFMNCDDPTWSNFWRFFHIEFERLGLKKIVSTHYESGETTSYKMEYMGGDDENVEAGIKTDLTQNGDFRSPESIELLKEADIVITNPPFSLFREYVTQLIEYNKKFIILGNVNALTYKEIFPLVKDNKIWLGASIHSGDRKFYVPDDYPLNASGCGVDADGRKYIRVKGVRWYTNMDYSARHKDLETTYLYSKKDDLYPELYQKYDNYDAINIDKTNEIPMDYNGVMGVPITFMDKHNPDQFEIIGLGNSRDNFTPNKDYINPKKHTKDGKIVNGGSINCVLTLETDKQPNGMVYYTSDNSKYLIPPYARILIKRKGGK